MQASLGETHVRTRALAVALLVLGLLSWTTAVVLGLRRPEDLVPLASWDVLWAGSFSAFHVLGLLIVTRRPTHPVGWILAIGPVSIGLAVAGFEYAGSSTRPAAAWVGLGAGPLFVLGIVCLGGLWALYYPDGSLPSPRWRWLVRALVTGWAIGAVLSVLSDAPYTAQVDVSSPLAVPGLEPIVAGVRPILDAVVLLGCVSALASLVVRFRRSRGVVREQLKLLVYVVLLAFLTVGINDLVKASQVLAGTDSALIVDAVLLVVALLSIPAAIAFSIVRHGAFDIDRIVGRTIAYTLVTAILVGLYVLGVIGFGWAARSLVGDSSDLIVALSTLTAAAVANPIRRRVLSRVERRFDRRRYDAERTRDEFGRALRDEFDAAAIATALADAARSALRPAAASIQLVDHRTVIGPR